MSNRDALAFYKKYQLVNSTRNFKQSLSTERICRYCKKDENCTSFNLKAHIIPELLGKNNFLTHDECDLCNQAFSAYESHLSKFFMPYLTMGGVEGKNGIPQFNSRTADGNEDTRTIVRALNNKREILLADPEDYTIDVENKRMTVVFRKPPHKPLWVFKALSKIGFSLIPRNSIVDYENVSNWLLNRDIEMLYFPLLAYNILTYKKMKQPFADLYKARRILYSQSFLPEYTLVFGFGNVVGQIFLPPSNGNIYQRARKKKPALEIFPGFSLDDLEQKESCTIGLINLIGNKTITYNQSLTFKFDDADFNIRT